MPTIFCESEGIGMLAEGTASSSRMVTTLQRTSTWLFAIAPVALVASVQTLSSSVQRHYLVGSALSVVLWVAGIGAGLVVGRALRDSQVRGTTQLLLGLRPTQTGPGTSKPLKGFPALGIVAVVVILLAGELVPSIRDSSAIHALRGLIAWAVYLLLPAFMTCTASIALTTGLAIRTAEVRVAEEIAEGTHPEADPIGHSPGPLDLWTAAPRRWRLTTLAVVWISGILTVTSAITAVIIVKIDPEIPLQIKIPSVLAPFWIFGLSCVVVTLLLLSWYAAWTRWEASMLPALPTEALADYLNRAHRPRRSLAEWLELNRASGLSVVRRLALPLAFFAFGVIVAMCAWATGRVLWQTAVSHDLIGHIEGLVLGPILAAETSMLLGMWAAFALGALRELRLYGVVKSAADTAGGAAATSCRHRQAPTPTMR
jgi:hypothetical protein